MTIYECDVLNDFIAVVAVLNASAALTAAERILDAIHRGVQFRSCTWRQKLIRRLPFLILPPRTSFLLPRSPRSNFELHSRVIYNSHRKFDLESRRGPLGDILCIHPPIYLLIRGYTRSYVRTHADCIDYVY